MLPAKSEDRIVSASKQKKTEYPKVRLVFKKLALNSQSSLRTHNILRECTHSHQKYSHIEDTNEHLCTGEMNLICWERLLPDD